MARIIPICNKAINISKILGQKRVCFLKIIKVRGEYSMKILARKIKFVTTIMFLSWTGFFTIPSFAQSLAADAPDLPFGEYLTARHALFNNQYNDAAENYLKALELDPENIILGQFTMSVLVTDGRVDEAIKIAHRLKAMGEENDVARLLVFFENTKLQNYQEALEGIDSLSDTGILNLIRPLFRAWIYADQGNIDQLEEIASSFEEGATFNFFNYFQAGLLYEYVGNDDQAELYYSKALAEKGLLNLRAVEAYANILQKQGKKSRAADILNEYLEGSPQNHQLKSALEKLQNGVAAKKFVSSSNDGIAEMFFNVATVLMQDNVKRVATNFLQYAFYFKPDFPLAHFLQAQIYESDKYYEGATNQLSKIAMDNPLYFQAKLQRAWLYDDMERPEEALAAFKALEDEYSDNREVLNSLAEFYRMHERYAEAIPTYDKIVKNIDQEVERDWVLYYTRGIVLDQEKRWRDAERDFLKALELKPEQPMVLNYLAYSWVDQGKNYERAKGMLERAVELRPNDGYIADSLGWALFKMGDLEQAVLILERAAQLQTQDWAINDHLGDVYWEVGRKNEARFQWRHALSLSPDEDKIEGIKSKIANGYSRSL